MRVEAIMRFPGLGLVLHALCFWPVWRWYMARLSDGSDDPWGIAALIAALLFTWPGSRFGKLPADDRLLAIAAVLTFGYAALLPFVPPLVRAACAMCALACSWVSFAQARNKLPAILVLFAISLPVIASLQFYAGYPLRSVTTAGTAAILNVLGLDVEHAGTALFWQGRTVLVDAPCSGVRMLWAGTALACVLALQRESVRWRSFTMLLIAVLPVVLMANTLRATALFIVETRDHPLPQFTHTAVGVATFVLAGACIVIVESFLRKGRRCLRSAAYA